jgi:hypothetical protein
MVVVVVVIVLLMVMVMVVVGVREGTCGAPVLYGRRGLEAESHERSGNPMTLQKTWHNTTAGRLPVRMNTKEA